MSRNEPLTTKRRRTQWGVSFPSRSNRHCCTDLKRDMVQSVCVASVLSMWNGWNLGPLASVPPYPLNTVCTKCYPRGRLTCLCMQDVSSRPFSSIRPALRRHLFLFKLSTQSISTKWPFCDKHAVIIKQILAQVSHVAMRSWFLINRDEVKSVPNTWGCFLFVCFGCFLFAIPVLVNQVFMDLILCTVIVEHV